MIQTTTPTNATRERTRVTIRPIEAVDASGLSDFYAALSPESRARRFLGASRGISQEMAARFAGADHIIDDGLVAVLHEQGPRDGQIVGHATLTSDGARPPEIAFAVADAWQRRGIGTALLREVIGVADRRGIPRLNAVLLADNVAMRRLLAKAGWASRITGLDGPTMEVEVERMTGGGFRR
jgi:RimJ/RimL family protein N-acetyltransferase